MVDGRIISQLGTRVDPQKQKVLLDGTRVKPIKYQYFMVNKPPGVLSTCNDPAGRTRVIDLIKTDQRVYNVGRLDKSSEGLILVTNDGDLANRLTHPRYGIQKTYLVTVAGRPKVDELASLKDGVYLAEGIAKVAAIRIKKRRQQATDLIIVLDEGRNREIRRLLAHIGHKVTRLQRVAIGPLRLGELPVGAHRRLEAAEIVSLKRSTSRTSTKRKPVRKNRVKHLSEVKTRGDASGRKSEKSTKKKKRDGTKLGRHRKGVGVPKSPTGRKSKTRAKSKRR